MKLSESECDCSIRSFAEAKNPWGPYLFFAVVWPIYNLSAGFKYHPFHIEALMYGKQPVFSFMNRMCAVPRRIPQRNSF